MKNKHIDLFKEMIPALDMGMKEMWDAADENGQKEIKGDLWNLNRYMSVVTNNQYSPYQKYSKDDTETAVVKTNELYNKNWAILGDKHPKLQWMILCQCGGTGKKENHGWIGFKKSPNENSKAIAIIEKMYPNMKLDEVELLARLLTKEELKQLIKDYDAETKGT